MVAKWQEKIHYSSRREREREKAMMVGLRCANICVRGHQEILAGRTCIVARVYGKSFGQVLFESAKRTSLDLRVG